MLSTGNRIDECECDEAGLYFVCTLLYFTLLYSASGQHGFFMLAHCLHSIVVLCIGTPKRKKPYSDLELKKGIRIRRISYDEGRRVSKLGNKSD